MKHWKVKLLIVAIVLAIGFFFGRMTKKTTEVEINTIDTLMVREFIHDTTIITDTILLSETDTLFIGDSTLFGDIPIRSISINDSLPINVKDKRYYLPFNLEITYRGLLYGYSIQTIPRNYKLQTTKDRLSWDLGLYAWVDQHKDISITTEGNLVFFNRFVLGTRIEANKDFEVQARIGIGLRL